MRARYIYESLNEELVGTYSGLSGHGVIEVWKNPPSINRMGSWARALTDQNGDFYIATPDHDEDVWSMATTHTDMINRLHDMDDNIEIIWNGKIDRYDKGIAWQRYKKTKRFYLSESYDDFKKALPYINEFMNTVNIYKPSGVQFILDIIDNAGDMAPTQADDYQQSQAHLY